MIPIDNKRIEKKVRGSHRDSNAVLLSQRPSAITMRLWSGWKIMIYLRHISVRDDKYGLAKNKSH